ncbi:MAG: FecR family protein, partial [Thermoanaerobaculia bacterium]
MIRLRCHSIPLSRLFGFILAALLTSTTSWAAQDQASYGFVRIIEGRADLMQASSSTEVELVTNYPLMVGDEIRVPYGSRVETLLPDGTYLRLDGDSELSFERLAQSADSEDQLSVLRLLQGETQLVLPSDTPSSEAFRVDTLNASIYLQIRGTYRIRTNGTDWSEIVVREGFAEVVTEQGSSIVRSGEQSIVEGATSPLVRVERAGARDELERWGDDLLAQVDPSDSRYVDPGLAYASAPLADSGHWVSVGGRSAWRPYVAAGWRPYHAGWWVHSPSGLTWVSTEPWGWVTYHYGGWDLAPGWGWVWYPGPVYTPASVFWYWGPTHVGWVPRPYYTHYYWPSYRSSWGFGYRSGVFGWAGGRPHHWAHWNFCQHRHFGRHLGPHAAHHGSYHRSGTQLSNMGSLQEIPRGVIATDTRALTPDLWNQPTAAMSALTASRVDANGNRVSGELPDVTPWVARSRQLPPQVEQAVMPRLRGGSVSTSPSRAESNSRTARQATTGSARDRGSEGRQVIRGGVSAPRASTSLSTSTARPTPTPRSAGSVNVTPTAGSRTS